MVTKERRGAPRREQLFVGVHIDEPCYITIFHVISL
jgi:hypothetical protein